MQIWPMYPEDVKRTGGHPAPFPTVLPQRLALMYSFAQAPETGFGGDLVLDMFNGTGATTLAAKSMGRHWLGIDLNPGFCRHAETRIGSEYANPHGIMLEDVKVLGARDSRQLDLFPPGSPSRQKALDV